MDKEMDKILYKYTPLTGEHKYDVITKGEIWFSKPDDFNDPLDSRLDFRQQYTQEEIENYWKALYAKNPQLKIDYALNNFMCNHKFTQMKMKIIKIIKIELE